jgi:hypothetical protein
MAHHLGLIVNAATARGPGASWVSAVGCIHRPNRKPCPGQIGIRRSDVPASVRWKCIVCGDEGVISGWEGTYADLTGSSLPTSGDLAVVVPLEMADVLQSIVFIDSRLERMVFAGLAISDGIVMIGSEDDFDELTDTVGTEANPETGLSAPQTTRRRLHSTD